MIFPVRNTTTERDFVGLEMVASVLAIDFLQHRALPPGVGRIPWIVAFQAAHILSGDAVVAAAQIKSILQWQEKAQWPIRPAGLTHGRCLLEFLILATA